MTAYRVYFHRHPDDPDAPLDHYYFAIRAEGEEAFARMFGAVRLEQMLERTPDREQAKEELKVTA